MKNWKTSLGGAFQSLGTGLMGAGIVPSLTSMTAAEELKWVVIAGFVLNAVGGFFAHLFSVDSTSIHQTVEKAIKAHNGDTDIQQK